ncbi:MAG: DUF1326 domain-containing protein [Alphaproteobacteria bacterium]|nr:DUF1326 domain-containing protein [Alphaproteobacteria bacterium]
MTEIDWLVEGISFGSCVCDYSCPCQFEALPTHGYCQGFEVFEIDKGHFGETRLDGLRAGLLYKWPGPIFEGNGELQMIIDERADADQRAALEAVLGGEETEEAATHWWVYSAMSSTIHETLYAPIEFRCDIEARTATVDIPGLLEASGRPIRSPVSGEEHRVRIEIPGGIEFDRAEIGSATTKSGAAIKLDLDDTYGQFNWLRHSRGGPVR